MNRQFPLNDDLNLRDSIILITDFIKLNGQASDEPRTLVKFVELLLSGTTTDIAKQESQKKEFQKAFCGNLPLSKLESLLQVFDNENCTSIIYSNLSCIAQTLYRVTNSDVFFRSILKKISLRFFTQAEQESLVSLVDNEKYSEFLYRIILHGVKTPYNVPCFFADRIYDEALTYDYDSPMRYSLMQTAADNGNKRAALEYGNYLAKRGPYEPAFDYLLLALPIQAALWNLAFLIENHLVGPDRLNQFKQNSKIDEKLASEEFTESYPELAAVVCSEDNPIKFENITCAYRTYFYLSQKGFFKAYNSLGKLLTQKKIVIRSDCTTISADSLIQKYYRRAICGGNIMAMCSEGSRLLKAEIANDLYAPENTDERYLLELLQASAETDVVRSYYNLGLYYEYAAQKASFPPKSREEIKKIYEHALKIDIDKSSIYGDMLIRLGRLSQEPKEKHEYFAQALKNGKADAAYDISLLLYNDYQASKNDYSLISSQSMLKDNLPYMSDLIKADATLLLEAIQAALSKPCL